MNKNELRVAKGTLKGPVTQNGRKRNRYLYLLFERDRQIFKKARKISPGAEVASFHSLEMIYFMSIYFSSLLVDCY